MNDERARVPYIVEKEEIPIEYHPQFDMIEETRGSVRGPFSVLMNSSEVAGKVGTLGAYLRYEGILSDATRELVIITVAREMNCPYEWEAHEPIARKSNINQETIGVISNEYYMGDYPTQKKSSFSTSENC